MNEGFSGDKAINRTRLFVASCLGLTATSVSFAVVGDIMNPLKAEFALTNAEVGGIAGAQLWGFTVSMVVFGPLVDAAGMRRLLRLALVCLVGGPLIMAAATGFWSLLAGALAIGLGNGLIEAVGNPLVATLYPDRKTEKLNQFHVWFPGGILIGGVLGFLFTTYGIGTWHWKLALVVVPALAYGTLFTGQHFPPTERVQSGISTAEMFRATFTRPLFLLLMVCMMLTATVELGPGRWTPAVFGAVGIPGILLLAFINGLMAALRQMAGPVVHRLSPTGVLTACAVVSGVGLWWLSHAETMPTAFAAGAVFAVGTAYFWPTMLGVAAERVPRGGALALALLGGIGAFTAGAIAAPVMGRIGDRFGHERLEPAATIDVLQDAVATLPVHARTQPPDVAREVRAAVDEARAVVADPRTSEGRLPPVQTATALREIVRTGGDLVVSARAAALLATADNYGGRVSFRYVATLSIVLTIVFGALFLRDRARGGYRVERIGDG